MDLVNLTAAIISDTVNNTFIGTLSAGVIITFLGLRLYRSQKELDEAFLKKHKIRELSVRLLTDVNVAVKDYMGQISLYDGSNGPAKLIYDKMESIQPGFWSKGTSIRFQKYVGDISKSFDELSTPLALNSLNEEKVKSLADAIPQLTFILNTTSTLSSFGLSDLSSFRKTVSDNADKIRSLLDEYAR